MPVAHHRHHNAHQRHGGAEHQHGHGAAQQKGGQRHHAHAEQRRHDHRKPADGGFAADGRGILKLNGFSGDLFFQTGRAVEQEGIGVLRALGRAHRQRVGQIALDPATERHREGVAGEDQPAGAQVQHVTGDEDCLGRQPFAVAIGAVGTAQIAGGPAFGGAAQCQMLAGDLPAGHHDVALAAATHGHLAVPGKIHQTHVVLVPFQHGHCDVSVPVRQKRFPRLYYAGKGSAAADGHRFCTGPPPALFFPGEGELSFAKAAVRHLHDIFLSTAHREGGLLIQFPVCQSGVPIDPEKHAQSFPPPFFWVFCSFSRLIFVTRNREASSGV